MVSDGERRLDRVVIRKEWYGPVNTNDNSRSGTRNEKIERMTMGVGGKVDVLMKMGRVKKVGERGGSRRGRIVEVKIEVTRNYEFGWVGVKKVNKRGEVR